MALVAFPRTENLSPATHRVIGVLRVGRRVGFRSADAGFIAARCPGMTTMPCNNGLDIRTLFGDDVGDLFVRRVHDPHLVLQHRVAIRLHRGHVARGPARQRIGVDAVRDRGADRGVEVRRRGLIRRVAADILPDRLLLRARQRQRIARRCVCMRGSTCGLPPTRPMRLTSAAPRRRRQMRSSSSTFSLRTVVLVFQTASHRDVSLNRGHSPASGSRPRAQAKSDDPGPRQNNPSGKSPESLSSPFEKIFRFSEIGKSVHIIRPSHPMRGADRESSRTRGGMRWTRKLRLTSATRADGEGVWSWRLDAGAKFAGSELPAGDGGNRARSHRGEHDISRKTIAQGRPDCFR